MERHWATPAHEQGEGHKNPRRNQGNKIVEVFKEPERARSKEESDHPELWEPNYVWRPDRAYRPEDPMGPWAPAMEIDPATRPETMKLAKMMVDRIPKKLGLQKITQVRRNRALPEVRRQRGGHPPVHRLRRVHD